MYFKLLKCIVPLHSFVLCCNVWINPMHLILCLNVNYLEPKLTMLVVTSVWYSPQPWSWLSFYRASHSGLDRNNESLVCVKYWMVINYCYVCYLSWMQNYFVKFLVNSEYFKSTFLFSLWSSHSLVSITVMRHYMHPFKHSAQLSYAYLDLNQKWVLKSAFEYFWKMFLCKNEKRTIKENSTGRIHFVIKKIQY